MFGIGGRIKALFKTVRLCREGLNSDNILQILHLMNQLRLDIETVRTSIKDCHNDIMTINDNASRESNRRDYLVESQILKIEDSVSRSFDELRQIGNLAVRSARRESGGPIRCAFLVHAMESWDSHYEIWRSMQVDARFEPLVFSINRFFPGDDSFGGEEKTSSALDRAGVPHIRLGMEPSFVGLGILRASMPDVIFRQSQWEMDVPEAFATPHLTFARLCSVPYGMSLVARFEINGHFTAEVSEKSFDQLWHRMAWRVFCESRQTRDYFVRFRHSDPAKFVVCGYPKLERLLTARDDPQVWPIDGGGVGRFRVIWAPHFSIGTDWLGFGTFDALYTDFLAFARERSDIDFVLKPHPALFNFAPKSGAITRAELDGFLAAWNALPNCAVELGTYAHLFAASDMMVTDGLSFLTEYPIFEKPLVFVDSGRHVPMNALGDAALAAAHSVRGFGETRSAIEHYAAGGTWARVAERKSLLDILFPCERSSIEIILNVIAEGFDVNCREVS